MKILNLIICSLFLSVSLYSQIWIDDFDGSNTNPFSTSTPAPCGGGALFDWYGVACLDGAACFGGALQINPAYSAWYSNIDGNFFGGMNTNSGPAGCGDDLDWAQWTGIDISSCAKPDKLYLCFKVASFGNNLDPSVGWDNPSSVSFSVTIDGGTPLLLTTIENTASVDSNPAFDLDCSGLGDTHFLDGALTEYCVQIPGQGSSIDVRVDIIGLNEGVMAQQGPDMEEIIIDDVAIYCQTVVPATSLDLGCGSPCTPVLPMFNPIAIQCAGAADPLPTTSLEGFTGTWSPVYDPNATTLYTFTPTPGCCLSPTTLNVIIDPLQTSTFTTPPAQCSGGMSPLPSMSNEGNAGTWSPSFDPNNTTTYTFTANAGICASTAMVTVTIDPVQNSTFAPIPNQCAGGADPLPTMSNEGNAGTWTPAYDPNNTEMYTFTASGNCILDGSVLVIIDPTQASTFTAIPSQCAGGTDPLPTMSNEGNAGSWSPSFDPNNKTTYTFTASGNCISGGMLTVTIDPAQSSTFTALPSQCEGGADPLPAMSNEGNAGSWSPSFDPNNTTTYTFTPSGTCISTGMLTVTIDPAQASTFTSLPSQCAGGADPLPTLSNEGNSGTWSPSFDPNNTTTYTFTPTPGLCANTGMLTVTIDPSIVPNFTDPAAVCELDNQVYALQMTSPNGISGTWSPAASYVPSVLPLGVSVFTFTPNATSCASVVTIDVTVNPSTIPTFTQLGPYCVGDVPDVLPTMSLNGIAGNWDGPINTAGPSTITYTFTPIATVCASTVTMSVIVNDCGCATPATVSINPVAAICENETIQLTAIIGGSASTISWASSGDGSFDNINSLAPIYSPGAADIASGMVILWAATDDPDGMGPCSVVTDQVILMINTLSAPLFTPLGPYCQGAIPDLLLTTSLNGISGSWDGTINTSTPGSTTYNFTPAANQCASNTTMAVVIDAPQLATFGAIPSQCSGGFSPLPATSIEGFTGMWMPVFDANNTTSYNFIVDAGQCALDGGATVTIDAAVLPLFTQLGPYCVDDVADVLPLTSVNGINGVWDGPIVTTGPGSNTYTFTPSTGQCATNATMQIQVNDCACVAPAQIMIEPLLPICENETISLTANLGGSAMMISWASGGDGSFDNATSITPIYTPGTNDIANGSVSLTATTDDPDGAGPCSEAVANVVLMINEQVVPQFAQLGPYCLGDVPDILTLTSVNGINGTWDGPIVTASLGTVTYIFTPSTGACATNATMEIVVNDCGCMSPAMVSIDPISPICENETIGLTGILGGSATMITWSSNGDGSFDNTTAITPIYTPGANDIINGSVTLASTTDDPDGAGPCSAAVANVVLMINAQAMPQFAQLGPYCLGDVPDVLPLTSVNGINGTWDGPIITSSPGLISYTFTPSMGACAMGTTMQIEVSDCACPNPALVMIDPIQSICENETISLVATIGGSATMLTWVTSGDGSFDNILSSTPTYTLGANDVINGSVNLSVMTDDPDGMGPCSEAVASVVLMINALETPQFTQLGPYCLNDVPDVLVGTSVNGITGTWDGPIVTDAIASLVYNFVADANQCASNATMQIEVNDCNCIDPAEISIAAITPICENETIDLMATLGGSASMVSWSSNGDGSFSNAIINTPTYTPGANDILNGAVNLMATTDDPDGLGPCTEAMASLVLMIDALEIPQFTQLGPYCVDDIPDVLALNAVNGIMGSWDGPISTVTVGASVYTFTPDLGQCADSFMMTVVVAPCDCAGAITITVPCDDNDECTINDIQVEIEGTGAICTPCMGEMVACQNGEITFFSCDDGDNCTLNDQEGILECTGAICVPCAGTVGSLGAAYVPNVFSPNGDGINDSFTVFTDNPSVIIAELKIYDRWGNAVFENSDFASNDTSLGWDGSFKGQAVVPGVYVFYALLVFEDCSSEVRQGHVTCLK